jgi:hypothetical protein
MYETACGTRQLACLRLVHFLRHGRWLSTTPRQPTAELFKQADPFGSEAKP